MPEKFIQICRLGTPKTRLVPKGEVPFLNFYNMRRVSLSMLSTIKLMPVEI